MSEQGTTAGTTPGTAPGATPGTTPGAGGSAAHGSQGSTGSRAALADRPTGRRISDRIVAASASGQKSLDQATASSRRNSAVLIVGPSGSGRKHFGRAIHSWSQRASGPLIVLPISSTPAALYERELFGSSDPASILSETTNGALVDASGGTLVLSGVDELDATIRQNLIQALKAGTFKRPGQSETRSIDVRIIATADSTDAASGAGANETWLGDIPVEIVRLSALSDRTEDVLPLAAHFLAEVAETDELKPVGFTSDARNWLVEEVWSANIRELRERIRQAVRLSRDGLISAEALMLANDGDDVPSFKDAKRAFETRYVEGLLRRCSGNISRAARLAKKDRKDFYDVIRRTGVDPSEFRH
jgi:two-component system response regulator GlrR